MRDSKWQWMDDDFGPMGWFTDKEKQQHASGFPGQSGHFRELEPKEITEQCRAIARLAYEQS